MEHLGPKQISDESLKWIQMEVYFNRRPWAPLDCAALNAESAARLGVLPLGRLGVKVQGICLVFLAVLEPTVCNGHLLLPSWLGFIFGLLDGLLATVAACSRASLKEMPVCNSLEIQGPLTPPAGPALAPFLALAQPQLLDALCRQVSRAGVWLTPGSSFAVRISGQVCAFRVCSSAISELLEEHAVAERQLLLCKPAAIVIQQVLPSLLQPSFQLADSGQCGVAAAKCLEGLRDAGLLHCNIMQLQTDRQATSSMPPRGSKSGGLIVEGIPPLEMLPDLLRHLHGRLEIASGRLAHLPLGQLLHELPLGSERGGGSASRALSRLLTAFTRNSLSHRCGLLVLWDLESCGALEVRRLSAALRPLRSLPSSCALLGLCTSRSRLTPSVRALFDNGDLPATVLDLELSLGSRDANAKQASSAKADPASAATPVIGCTEVRAELQAAVVSYYTHTELFKSMGVAWPPRVLVHGPPGSGKTHLLRWLCMQLPPRVRVQWVHPGEIWSRYLGESEEHLRTVFAKATEGATAAGSVLVLEGLDQLAPHRRNAQAIESQDFSGLRDRLAATLLTCLDGVDSAAGAGIPGSPGLGVLASSCVPAEELDPRVTRPGRMDRWIALGAPGASSRVALLQHFISNEGGNDSNYGLCADPSAEVFNTIAQSSEGMCAGQLRRIAKKAWANLPLSQRIPSWTDIIDALSSDNLTPHVKVCTSSAEKPLTARNGEFPSWRPDQPPDASEHSADWERVPVPDSDSDGL